MSLLTTQVKEFMQHMIDSTPISMQMDLTFKEIEPIYDEDYQDSDVGVGF